MLDGEMVSRVTQELLCGGSSYAEIAKRQKCSEKSVERIASILKIVHTSASSSDAHVTSENTRAKPDGRLEPPSPFDEGGAMKRARLKALLDYVSTELDPNLMSKAEHPADQVDVEALANYMDEIRAAMDAGADIEDGIYDKITGWYRKVSYRVLSLENAESNLSTMWGHLGQVRKQLNQAQQQLAIDTEQIASMNVELKALVNRIEQLNEEKEDLESLIQYLGGRADEFMSAAEFRVAQRILNQR